MFYDSVDAHPPNFKIDFGSPSLLATVNTILHYQQNKVHQITELVCPNRNSFLLSSDELHRNETGASIAFKNFKKFKRVMLTGNSSKLAHFYFLEQRIVMLMHFITK